MNIFVTASSVELAASSLDDVRLNKMIVESCQMLSTVMHKKGVDGPYKVTHPEHPCTLWVEHSNGNFSWLIRYTEALLLERTWRFPDRKPHKCEQHMETFRKFCVDRPVEFRSRFALVTTDFDHLMRLRGEDHDQWVERNYQAYMRKKWNTQIEMHDLYPDKIMYQRRFGELPKRRPQVAKWTRRGAPPWR